MFILQQGKIKTNSSEGIKTKVNPTSAGTFDKNMIIILCSRGHFLAAIAGQAAAAVGRVHVGYSGGKFSSGSSVGQLVSIFGATQTKDEVGLRMLEEKVPIERLL